MNVEQKQKLIDLIDEADTIFQSSMTWGDKYVQIFNLNIISQLRELHYSFDYYDPDTSYEDDTIAYHQSLMAIKNSL